MARARVGRTGLRTNLTCKEKSMKTGSGAGHTFRKETSIAVPDIPATAHQGWKPTTIKGASTLALREGMSKQRALGPGKSRMVPLISDSSCMLVLSQNVLLDLRPCSSSPSPHAKQIIRCQGCDGPAPAAWHCSSAMWDERLPPTHLHPQQLCSSAGNAVVYIHTAHSHPLPTASQLKPQAY